MSPPFQQTPCPSHLHIPRTRQIIVGGVPIGGGAPVAIQSMLNTRTTDVAASLEQIRKDNPTLLREAEESLIRDTWSCRIYFWVLLPEG